ncbi:MAG: Mammalian cell entry related domain protein [Conexibacter sp.]|nr:Mammalian cell entry related domain protein [Conexibacter sp.]
MRRTAKHSPEVVTRQRRVRVAVGAAVMATAVLLVYIGYQAPQSIPGREYYRLQAEFDRADNLAAHYQVRMGGRLIGQVLNPESRDGRARVELQLTPDVRPLLSDTRLRVRPRSAIGVRFVEVVPGTRGHPLEEGALIPSSSTSSALPLDSALGILDARRRAALRTVTAKLGGGVAGRGQDLNASISAGSQLFSGLRAGLKPVNDDTGAVEGFVAGLSGLAGATAPVRDDIALGFDPAARAFGVLADHRDGIRDTLSAAPPALDAVRTRLPATDRLLVATSSLARHAVPTLTAARPALTQASALLRESRPSLRAADETLDLAGRAVPPTLALLKLLPPVLPGVDEALVDAAPIVREVSSRGCDLLAFATNWAEATALGNAGGQFLRLVLMSPGPELFQSKVPEKREHTATNPYPAPCEAGKEAKP